MQWISTLPGGCASGCVASTRCAKGGSCASLTRDCGRPTVSRAFKRERRVFRGRRHDLVREPDAGDLHVRIDERRLETGLRRGVRHRHRESRRQQLPPSAYRYRASRRLYTNRFGQYCFVCWPAAGSRCGSRITPRAANPTYTFHTCHTCHRLRDHRAGTPRPAASSGRPRDARLQRSVACLGDAVHGPECKRALAGNPLRRVFLRRPFGLERRRLPRPGSSGSYCILRHILPGASRIRAVPKCAKSRQTTIFGSRVSYEPGEVVSS